MIMDRQGSEKPATNSARTSQVSLANSDLKLLLFGRFTRMNYGTVLKNFDLNDEHNQKKLMSRYAKVRGYLAYWKQVKYELRAHVAAFGVPVWYSTLNPDIKGWKRFTPTLRQFDALPSECQEHRRNDFKKRCHMVEILEESRRFILESCVTQATSNPIDNDKLLCTNFPD